MDSDKDQGSRKGARNGGRGHGDGGDERPRRGAPKKEGGSKRSAMVRYSLLAGLVWIVLAGGVVVAHFSSNLPDTNNLLAYDAKSDITLLDVKGRVIARRGLTQGASVTLNDLPDYVANAFIAIEDRRFRMHFGIDPIGLTRALAVDIYYGAFVQGGSTITQQLARNLFLKPDRTLSRKIDEAFLALQLERHYTKDEILQLYLNRVYFGAGVYGIEAASQRFFDKSPSELTLTEAAILAGCMKAPSRYNPATDPDAALARAATVLAVMEDVGFISEDERRNASTTRPKIAKSMATPGAGYFIDYAAAQVPEYVGAANKDGERLIVETTLDLEMQNKAERAVTTGLLKEGGNLSATQGALVAMTPDGGVRALVGGRSYDESPFNRAIDARRQPGSSFKAFVYLAALERGRTPYDEVFDGPITIGNWTPGNYEGNYKGSMTLAHALAYSSNSVAVQLTREVGPQQVVRVAHRLGITANLQAVPALALGTSEVSPFQLVTAYASFANGGRGVIPYAIARIRTPSGKILYARKGSGFGQVMSAQSNAAMTTMMMQTISEGTGKAARLDRPVAGKTGTTQDYHDAWFVGFTADLVCGIWIGNDDNSSMKRATGGGLPARMFKSFMTEAERGKPVLPLAGQRILAETVSSEAPLTESSPETQTETETASLAREPEAPKKDVLDAFQSLLDSLF